MLAEEIRQIKNFEKIIFLPTGNPPHKSLYVSSEDRLNMVKLACMDNDAFEVSDLEVKNKKISYTIDSLKILKEKYDNINYIIGSDTVFQLKTWKSFEKLPEYTKFIFMKRPGYDLEKDLNMEIQWLKEEFGFEIEEVTGPLYDISSHDIREDISKGRSLKYILPEKVREYISDKRLYERRRWVRHYK